MTAALLLTWIVALLLQLAAAIAISAWRRGRAAPSRLTLAVFG